MGVPQRLRHEERNPEDELALGDVLGRALVRRVRHRVGGRGRAVEQIDVTQQEHPLPRHQHVVEEHDAVHLLEARAEGMLEVRPPEVEALAAQELQPRRAAGDGEVERERAVGLGVPRDARRVDGDLVRQGAERRQDARAVDHDAGVGLAHHLERRPHF